MTTSPDLLYALVPAAGAGERAGGAKLFRQLGGQTVIAHTLAALADVPRIKNTLVVRARDDVDLPAQAPRFTGWCEPCGGATRAASVRAGLAALRNHGARTNDWVLVHDAARCLVQPAAIDRLIDSCIGDEVGGLLALPLADTLKDADAQGRVRATIAREGKWLAQTPQMFRLGLLAEALEHAGDTVTDEASAVEALGYAPKLVAGDADNFKLTWPQDFARAERVLAARDGRSRAIRPFVPARELAQSRAFYEALGFAVTADHGDVLLLAQGATSFLLQAFYEPAHANNFMLSLQTDDLDAWYARAQLVAEHFGTRIDAPALRPWGLRDFVLIDPAGVLWRIAQTKGAAT